MHEESSEALLCHLPGLKVVVPSGPYSAKGLLLSAIRDADPVVFLEPTRLYRMIREEVPDNDYTIPLGVARVVRSGTDVTVVAWGSMLERVLKTDTNRSVEVVDPQTLTPFDWTTLLTSVRKTGRLVIVHEAVKSGGFGAEIAATVAEEAILHLRAPILRVTSPDVVLPLSRLIDHYLPTTDRIRAAIDEVMRY
jgi:pyruvate dehydrogenase E1 component beta subunit